MEKILNFPDMFVLKPQREGGGTLSVSYLNFLSLGNLLACWTLFILIQDLFPLQATMYLRAIFHRSWRKWRILKKEQLGLQWTDCVQSFRRIIWSDQISRFISKTWTVNWEFLVPSLGNVILAFSKEKYIVSTQWQYSTVTTRQYSNNKKVLLRETARGIPPAA